MSLFYGLPLSITQSSKRLRYTKASFVGLSLLALLMTAGCTPTPPDHRPQVTAPIFEAGDSKHGEMLYADNCQQCHTLRPGSNKKGPQLVGVYGASSGILSDYNYSDAMDSVDWVWDAEKLDAYIAEPEAVLPETLMLSDPMPNEQDRKDIIAYLSTLGRDALPEPESK